MGLLPLRALLICFLTPNYGLSPHQKLNDLFFLSTSFARNILWGISEKNISENLHQLQKLQEFETTFGAWGGRVPFFFAFEGAQRKLSF